MVRAMTANYNMNFEPYFLIVGLELVSTRSYTMSVQTTLTCISATVFKSRYDYQLLLEEGGGGGGSPRLNVIMTLILVWKYGLLLDYITGV